MARWRGSSIRSWLSISPVITCSLKKASRSSTPAGKPSSLASSTLALMRPRSRCVEAAASSFSARTCLRSFLLRLRRNSASFRRLKSKYTAYAVARKKKELLAKPSVYRRNPAYVIGAVTNPRGLSQRLRLMPSPRCLCEPFLPNGGELGENLISCSCR